MAISNGVSNVASNVSPNLHQFLLIPLDNIDVHIHVQTAVKKNKGAILG